MADVDTQTAQEGFEQDQKAYWEMWDELLKVYPGKWVAVHKAKIVAIADTLLGVAEEGAKEDGYAYCNCVGKEDEIVVVKRRLQFSYDLTYAPTALPRITAHFMDPIRSLKRTFTNVIPDTGCDLTCLPIQDCQALDLFRFPIFSGRSRSFGGTLRLATFYRGTVEINGLIFPSIIEPVPESERLLGREVLNRCQVTFDGPGGQTLFAL